MYYTEWWPWADKEYPSEGFVSYTCEYAEDRWDVRCIWIVPLPYFPKQDR